MREIVVAVLAVALGGGVGTSYYWSQTKGERNSFEVFKTVGSLPTDVLEVKSGRARVSVDGGNTFDFGTMGKSETRSHTFMLRNDGNAPLQIKLLETSCKCTLAEMKEEEIPPGGTRELTLEWTPEDYSDQFAQNARIQTNDPDNRILELRVQGAVSVPVRPFPQELVIPSIEVADGFEEHIDILAYETDQLQVTDISWGESKLKDLFEVRTETLDENSEPRKSDPTVRSGVRVVVVAQPGLPLGPLREMLTVTTNQPDEKPFEIPVFGRVRGDYEFKVVGAPFDIDRNQIDLGQINVNATRSLEFNMFVRSEAADDVEVSIDPETITPGGVLSASVGAKKKIGPLTAFPIKIELVGRGQSISRLGPGPKELGQITISTTDPTTPTIQLFVKFALTE